MSDVASSSLDVFFKDARKRGIDANEFLRNTDITLAQMRNSKFRLTWAQFLVVLKNIGDRYTPEEQVSLGGKYLRSPIFSPFALVTRLLFKAKDCYKWIYSPNSPVQSVFACITPTCIEHSENEVVVTLTLKPGLETSAIFNNISKGAVIDLARLVGESPATVTMEALPDGARYIARLAGGGGSLAWLWKLIRWPFSVFRAGRALKEAHEDLRERYFELDSAKQLLALQATKLETAFSISQLAHADLDLGRTLESVASSLVSMAGYAGASVALHNLPSNVAAHGEMSGAPGLVRTLEARDATIGAVALWFSPNADLKERADLADAVMPTVALALHSALTHAELLDAQQHLERRVEQRTAELTVALRALEESEQARTRIFANVNHEIRTPLTLVLLSIEELRRSGAFDAAQDRSLGAIARNARKLLRLVDGLLLLAAGDEQKLTIAPRETEIPQLVAEVVEGFAASARSCELTLRVETDTELKAEVDDTALDRILSNLVSNAIKFTPAGGEIVVTAKGDGANVVFTVRDTGVGISEKFLTRVFGRFEQDARPLRPGAVGSGIGLSIVQSLAEAHFGKAEVERLPIGTLFRVTIPRVASPQLRRDLTPEGKRPRRSTPSDFGLPSGADKRPPEAPVVSRENTVLVVEDDDELRALISAILSPFYHVLSAVDGESALALTDTHSPDMLVSDVGLPGMDGLELTRRFRSRPGNRLAPVLLLTALVSLESRLSGFEAGAVDYMTKPFEPSELIARVRAQLDRRRMALRLHESEKLAAIGTMSSGLAHEMRNPANALVNAVEPLLELLPEDVRAPGSPVADLLEIIKDASSQIGRLSKQLLGFRRDGTEVATEVVPASTLVERSVAITRAVLKDIDLRLDLRYPGDVSCAAALVLQVMCNLLDNAAHAAGAGGWVSVTTFVEAGRFVCEIGDSGPGVPPPLRERIFEPFFTTKAPGEGTGLGLSTARQIAERHHGTLFVRPTETSTVFRLELPLTSASSELHSPRLTA